MRLIEAVFLARTNAADHADCTPTLGTLLEEVAEFGRALEGKHEHPPALELVQILGIGLNLLTAYDFNATCEALNLRNAEKGTSD